MNSEEPYAFLWLYGITDWGKCLLLWQANSGKNIYKGPRRGAVEYEIKAFWEFEKLGFVNRHFSVNVKRKVRENKSAAKTAPAPAPGIKRFTITYPCHKLGIFGYEKTLTYGVFQVLVTTHGYFWYLSQLHSVSHRFYISSTTGTNGWRAFVRVVKSKDGIHRLKSSNFSPFT